MSLTLNRITKPAARKPINERAADGPDANLLRECAEFQEMDTLLRRWDVVPDEADDNMLAAVADEWWKCAEGIAATQAETNPGKTARADAAFAVMRMMQGNDPMRWGKLSALDAATADAAGISYLNAPSPDMDLLRACGAFLGARGRRDDIGKALNTIRSRRAATAVGRRVKGAMLACVG